MSYQPIVIDEAINLMMVLEETQFFDEYEIKTREFAMEYLCQRLTDKFILGTLTSDGANFTEDEMEGHLREIIVGSIMLDLKDIGIVDSIEDIDDDEVFFLTEKGKQYADDLKRTME